MSQIKKKKNICICSSFVGNKYGKMMPKSYILVIIIIGNCNKAAKHQNLNKQFLCMTFFGPIALFVVLFFYFFIIFAIIFVLQFPSVACVRHGKSIRFCARTPIQSTRPKSYVHTAHGEMCYRMPTRARSDGTYDMLSLNVYIHSIRHLATAI